VQTTVSIDSGGNPAAVIAATNGSCMWWKNSTVRSLSLPTQVSTWVVFRLHGVVYRFFEREKIYFRA
jgi:hypothetical protein